MPFPEELKKRWIEALKSGTYVKGTGGLVVQKFRHSEEAYCCLGVLCDITIPEERPGWRQSGTIPHEYFDKVLVGADRDTKSEFKTIQDELAFINDSSEGWHEVIKAIEEL